MMPENEDKKILLSLSMKGRKAKAIGIAMKKLNLKMLENLEQEHFQFHNPLVLA